MMPHQPDLKRLVFGGASAVLDSDMSGITNQLVSNAALADALNDLTVQHRFVAAYQSWIGASERNRLQGLDAFAVTAFSNGTTESFDKFMLKNHHCRFRCFRGEYMYHGAAWRNYFPNWCYIEDQDLAAGDAVVMSTPFSDTGNVHAGAAWLLDQCDRLSIPVLIDSAFFGICSDIEFDYDRDCVTDITFSLSKTFPVSHLRIGMRLTRLDDDDSLLVHHKTNYTNRLGAAVGLELLATYGADHVVDQYKATQIRLCAQLDIQPSHTVIFGLGGAEYGQYNRGGATNRLCLARYLKQGELPA